MSLYVFTCFTSSVLALLVQMLACVLAVESLLCFTSSILALLVAYWLYWYKSTSTPLNTQGQALLGRGGAYANRAPLSEVCVLRLRAGLCYTYITGRGGGLRELCALKRGVCPPLKGGPVLYLKACLSVFSI